MRNSKRLILFDMAKSVTPTLENMAVTVSRPVRLTVIVAALGYFVDVFDIVLFQMLRVSSLKSLGLNQDQVLDVGVQLFNVQLIGMLLGGFLWGIVGDKVGRLYVLFGSILLYSIGNLANSAVTSVDAYLLCRFISGIGLAGEVGSAITLVAELLHKNQRGIGTAVVATAGTCGALTASLTAQLVSWRTSYLVGGILGLTLLVLRFRVCESMIFKAIRSRSGIRRGDLRVIFSSREKILSYLTCIFSGLPLFFTLYVLVAFAPEVGHGLGISGELETAKASLYFTASMILGDLSCGLLSQKLRSRKQALNCFIVAAFIFTAILLSLRGATPQIFYLVCVPTGFFIGYWAVYVTAVAEQFGTNLRSTVTTSALNLVRATPIAMVWAFLQLKGLFGVVASLQIVGILAFICSLYFVNQLKETFAEDLDFVE